MGNGATGATDASGLSPTRNATVPLPWLILRIRLTEAQYPKKSPAEHLQIIQNEMCHTFMATEFNVAMGLIDKQKGERFVPWGYIYTEEKEWVDLGHFFTNSRAAIRYPNLPAWVLAAAGIAYEEHSRQEGETNPTRPGVGSTPILRRISFQTRLGVEFGKSLKNNVSLSQQVEEFFTKLGKGAN